MSTFQRARTPEQQEQRRQAILDAARTMLSTAGPVEISLRELSARVGLAKSNVVRYFPTREAVFLAVLVEDWSEVLDGLERTLGPAGGAVAPDVVARAVAEAVVGHDRFCALLSAAPTVLERNVPLDTARTFKHEALGLLRRTAEVVGGAAGLPPERAERLAGVLWALVAGAWPLAHPSPSVAAALEDPDLAPLRVDLVPDLAAALTALLVGMGARGADRDAPG